MDRAGQNTIVVVPCYNEADRLDLGTFVRFAEEHSDVGFLLVNDGSSDNTRRVIEGLERRRPWQFGVEHLAVNRGKAEAVRRGMLKAAASAPQFVGYWDADLATPLDAILPMREVLRRQPLVQLVLGSRFPLLGRGIHRKMARRIAGRAFASVASKALGVRVRDTQCGAKLFRATPLVRDLFADPFSSRWIFDVELLARLGALAAAGRCLPLEQSAYELPLDRWQEVAGSRLRTGDFALAARDMLALYRRYPLRPRALHALVGHDRWQPPVEPVPDRRAA